MTSEENVQFSLETTNAASGEYILLNKFDDGEIISAQPSYSHLIDENKVVELQEQPQTFNITFTNLANLEEIFPHISVEKATELLVVDSGDDHTLNFISHDYSSNVETDVEMSSSFNVTLDESSISYKCDPCDKIFTTENDLGQHLQCHTKIQPYACEICDKHFSQRSNLWKHVQIHTGERPFECPQCKRKFSQRANMQKHFKIHTGEKPFKCVHCSHSFAQLANLNKHVQLHLGTQPYRCKYCDKPFSQRSNLLKHQSVHEGVKRFSCPYCHNPFTQQDSLQKHIALHTDERPHICEACGKTYIQAINLMRHQQKCRWRVTPTIQMLFDVESNNCIKILDTENINATCSTTLQQNDITYTQIETSNLDHTYPDTALCDIGISKKI